MGEPCFRQKKAGLIRWIPDPDTKPILSNTYFDLLESALTDFDREGGNHSDSVIVSCLCHDSSHDIYMRNGLKINSLIFYLF